MLLSSRDAQAFQFCKSGFAVVFLFKVSDQIIPEQTAEAS
jgi:hypothetical protein